MRQKGKSPLRQGQREQAQRGQESSHDWVSHLYKECSNPFKFADAIKEIIEVTKFKKAIIYASNDQNARDIYNTRFQKVKEVEKFILTRLDGHQNVMHKYFNFILENGRILITSLSPAQTFPQAGKINIEDIDLIINEVLPLDPNIYISRIEKFGPTGNGNVVSLVEKSSAAELLSNRLKVNILNIKNVNSNGLKSKTPEKKDKSKSPYKPQNMRPVNEMKQSKTNYIPREKTPERNGRMPQNIYADEKTIPTEESFRPKTPTNRYKIPESSPLNKSQKKQDKNEMKTTNLRSQSPINNKDKERTNGAGTPKGRSSSQTGYFNQRPLNKKNSDKLREIRSNVIGLNTSFISGCLLDLEAVYVDHTATNRPYRAVEEMVNHAKLLAANPHTEFSYYGEYSTNLMKYARDSLLRSFNAPEGVYTVLPTGAGSTGAIEKTVLLLKGLAEEDETWREPTIFVTPYQHHSNILPWVEFYENIQVLAHNNVLTLETKKIFQQIMNSESERVIVSVSAASNVTSKLTHLDELNSIIKKIRLTKTKTVVFCVDCAAFCCHQQLDLQAYDEIDFAFLSPHKNLGGAESCGVLVARNSLLSRLKPTFPGGGTVKFVKGYTRDDVMYETDNFSRQIAGTPPYFGFYRAALSFELLTNEIGYDFIHEQEKNNTELFFFRVKAENKKMQERGIGAKIEIYGDQNLKERANVVTFNIVYEHEDEHKSVHQNFVSLILTDIFGIQVRSGCFCAGPHGIELLKLTESNILVIEEEVQAGLTINKPGYVRIDLAFYLESFEVEYIVGAISLIAQYWKNYEKIYTLSREGEIYLPKAITKLRAPHIYSLSDLSKASEKFKEEEGAFESKLRNRQGTLERQLEMGERISQNPVDYMNQVQRRGRDE